MHLALALALAALVSPNTVRDGESDAQPLVLRGYELTSLERPPAPGVDELLLPVLDPFQSMATQVLAGLREQSGTKPRPVPERSAQLVVDLLGEELHCQGCDWSLGVDGRLWLLAPEATQRRAAELVAALDRHLNASVRLRVEVFESEVEPGAGGAGQTTLEAQLEAARARGALRSLSLELSSGLPESLNLSRALWTVLDYETEVAQAMVASHPRPGIASVGLRLSISAAPAPTGGLNLACVVQDGSLRGSPELRRIGRSGLVTLDSSSLQVPLPGAFTHLALERRAYVVNAHLAPEGALVLSSDLVVGAQTRRQFVVLRIEGGALPTSSPLGTFGNGRAALLDRYALAPPVARTYGLLGASHPRPRGLVGGRFHSDLLRAHIGGKVEVDIPELFLTGAIESHDEYLDSQLLLVRAADAPAELVLPVPSPRNVMLEIVLRRSGSGETVATLGLPVATGQETAALVGTEATGVFGYDTQIAQGAAGAGPTIDALFDGLLVVAKAQPSASGGPPRVELDVFAHVLDGELSVALGTSFLESIDTPRFRTLFAGRRFLADGELHRIGDGGSREGGLVLEVRAR